MKRTDEGLIDRTNWPTRAEIAEYIQPRGNMGGTHFEYRVAQALIDLHDLVDRLDSEARVGSPQARIGILERVLAYYADPARYRRWGSRDQQDHWVFDARVWGNAEFWAQPPPYADDKPYLFAQKALKGAIVFLDQEVAT